MSKAECTVCGLIFSGVPAFDRHRIGEWSARRCRTIPEMISRSYRQNKHGLWTDADEWDASTIFVRNSGDGLEDSGGPTEPLKD